jgi:NAD(P)-dependent dehydrogenase (short-subunit alcohol dehydrogenase family)
MSFTLRDKTVLVTGGASGIGAAVVELLGELGARVVIADLRAAELTGDVAAPADAQRLVDEAVARLGRLDVLVNCAGISDTLTPTIEQTFENWQRVMDVDLTGTYLMCKAAGAHMIGRGGGAIVNIASICGLGGFPRRNAYGAAKAGVVMLTRNLACEWGQTGVRVNCVAPGYVRTPMVGALLDANKIDAARIHGRTPMSRMGTPREIAQAVAYLASDWSSFVTGATLPVDGGWSAFSGSGDVATA